MQHLPQKTYLVLRNPEEYYSIDNIKNPKSQEMNNKSIKDLTLVAENRALKFANESQILKNLTPETIKKRSLEAYINYRWNKSKYSNFLLKGNTSKDKSRSASTIRGTVKEEIREKQSGSNYEHGDRAMVTSRPLLDDSMKSVILPQQ